MIQIPNYSCGKNIAITAAVEYSISEDLWLLGNTTWFQLVGFCMI